MKKLIVKLNHMLSKTDREKLRQEIKEQLNEGVVVLDGMVKDVEVIDVSDVEVLNE